MPPTIISRNPGSLVDVRIGVEGDHVKVIKNGALVFDMTWDAALQLAKALQLKGKQAEEFAKRDQIAFDQAILQRRGLRFGLTRTPHILKRAGFLAAWSRTLRRAMPGGVQSQEAVGTPAVQLGPPPTPSHRQE